LEAGLKEEVSAVDLGRLGSSTRLKVVGFQPNSGQKKRKRGKGKRIGFGILKEIQQFEIQM
jgi:hypothetical protein